MGPPPRPLGRRRCGASSAPKESSSRAGLGWGLGRIGRGDRHRSDPRLQLAGGGQHPGATAPAKRKAWSAVRQLVTLRCRLARVGCGCLFTAPYNPALNGSVQGFFASCIRLERIADPSSPGHFFCIVFGWPVFKNGITSNFRTREGSMNIRVSPGDGSILTASTSPPPKGNANGQDHDAASVFGGRGIDYNRLRNAQ
jgi:hypothetical protein